MPNLQFPSWHLNSTDFLLANRLHFYFTEMLYVYRYLYCNRHAL